MNDQPVIAIDVGGSSIKSALVEAGSRIAGSVSIDTIQSKANADQILATLSAIINRHLQSTGRVRGVAFGFPGPFNYERGICLIRNQDKYDALYGLDISANLKNILGMPHLEIRYRNDAEAAILGEALYGTGRPYSRLVGLTLGTGLGSAFVAHGRAITEGADVPTHGWLYSLPYGTQRADDVFSTRGLLARLREAGFVAADIASAIQKAEETGESLALAEVFDSFGSDLGIFLEPYVSAFRADAVLISGGIAETWEHFSRSLIQALPTPAVKGILGTRAALLGAAAIYF